MFGWFSEVELRSARLFAEDGVDTSADVTGKYSESKEDTGGKYKRRFYLSLEFQIQTGEVISTSQPVQLTDYNQNEPGDVIEIRYLRSDPRKVEVTKRRSARTGRIYRSLAWLSVLAVLAGIWVYGSRALDAFRARKYGMHEEVKMIEVRKIGWWIFGNSYRLIWRDSTGRLRKSLPKKADKLMGFRPGDRLVVFHGDKRSWWAGDVGERANG